MSDEPLFEYEAAKTGAEAATLLRELADAFEDGTSIELADGDRSVAVDAPDELSLEVELEREGADVVELELEFEWEGTVDEPTAAATEADEEDAAAGGAGAAADADDDGTATEADAAEGAEVAPADSLDAEISAGGDLASLARFQVFRDRADEWRWRLVHRNGNVIATSGEGYTRRHNAEKGLRSVVENAPGADVEDAD
ncbi:amphi-Trp domain-containing protein [Halomicrobium salinisoli]|uniref:amphi-Trp domain-containing protein n=1 Tax=Halomicrobium salinisoli TaxID=2878391 RepID=UPI001CEFE49A|nr:amphi-Trp domain-containing protein [Halomicrobium salinisoli]